MTASRQMVLTEAGKVICGERKNQYGEPEDSFEIIAKKWSATLTGYFGEPVEIPDWVVAVMMVDLKTARQICGEGKLDNFIDMSGYGAIGGELFTRGKDRK